MATDAIYKYLQDTNRPYSANDILMNLHKEYGKTAVQKALDQLTECGKIREKTYGKQKVYSIVQPDEDDPQESELNEIETEVLNMSENLRTAELNLKSCESQLQELLSTPTTEEGKKKEELLNDIVEKLQNKLKVLSENTIQVSSEEREMIKKEREKCVKEYRKRKRICMDIIDAILEGYPKDKKSLISELGIETDEDVNMMPLV
ncbi:homologous-pairing protein 2 homolog [Lycorma delicatula]|uniref:homologous-pairing protein 2 homolog n=1 Tax=Lycorma delicatula TaxID=130591 RepID=UPI003F515C82